MEEGRSARLPSSLCNGRRDNGSERSRILHNVFKMLMPILENSVANISYVHYINISVIIIDEVYVPFTSVKNHRLLRDLCNENDKRKPFGGKTKLLCGDFRKILPVIPHESRGT